MAHTRSSKNNNSTANLGFEQKLWLTTDSSSFSLSAFDFASTTALLVPLSCQLSAFRFPKQLLPSSFVPYPSNFLSHGRLCPHQWQHVLHRFGEAEIRCVRIGAEFLDFIVTKIMTDQ